MAVELATTYVAIVPTTKGIAGQLDKELGGPIEQAAKRAGDTAGRSLEQTGKSFTKFGVGALAVAGVVGAGLFKAGESASNLGESVNAVQVTFGSAAGGILKLGQEAATSVGLSNAAFNSLAVQFSAFATTIAGKGGDVVGTMKDLTGRAADFASVMNIDVADAATLFQSGLAGETEPLRKYGIDLSAAAVQNYALAHGIGTVGKQLSESEKVQARYALLMESTAKTQGDFANTSDSAANATRIAKAEMENAAASLGASLTPAMAFAAGKVADLAKWFANLNEATNGWIGKAAGIAALAIGVAGGLSVITGQVIKMSIHWSKLKGLFIDSEGGLTRIGQAAKNNIGPLAILGVAAIGLGLRAKAVAAALRELGNAAADLSKVSDEEVFGTMIRALNEGGKAGKSVDEIFKTLAQTNLEGARRALDMAEAQGVNEDIVKKLRRAILDEIQAKAQATSTTQKYSDTTGDASAATGDLTGKTEALSAADIILKGATDGIAAAAAEAKRKGDEYAQSLIDQRQRVEDLYATERSAVDAKYAFAESSRQALVDLSNLNTVLADHKSKQEDIDTAVRTASGSILKASEDYATLNGAALGSENGVRRQIDALSAQAATLAPGSPLRTFLEGYIADLHRVQTDIQTRLTLNISMGQVSTAAGDIIGVRAGLGKQFAEGGYTPGGRVLLGEDGPELVDLPSHSYVHTAAASRSLMQNTDFNLTNRADGTQRPGLNIEHIDVHNDTDADGFFRYANFLLAA